MDWLWTVGTIGGIILVFGGGYWLLNHVSLPTRAKHADPEAAEALSDVQRQIEQGREADLRPGWHKR